MSVHMIYYKDGVKMMRPILNREEYLSQRDGGEQQSLLKGVREGKEQLKSKLVQMNYSCLPNEDGTLKGSKRMSSSIGMDIDHIGQGEMEELCSRILGKKDELGLLMLEKSARGQGYHLAFRRKQELSQEENLRWASNLLGVEYDKGAKDITRVFFTTTNDDLLFLDDEVFCIEEAVMKKNTNGTNLTNKTLQYVAEETADITPQEVGEASAQSLEAFDLCVGLAGLKADAMDVWGVHNWHANLMAVLSVGVAKLMTKEQLRAVVAHRLPNYSQTEDCQKLIDYFYEKYDANKGFMNTALREINAKAQQKTSESTQKAPLSTEPQDALSRMFASNLPPEMPSKLPRLVKEVTKSTPKLYQATVAQAMFPALATYPKHLSFMYTDNQVRELRINCLIIAGTGTGKDICTKQPLTHIIADIKQRDEMNRERLKKFNEEYNSKANNKQKPQRPADLVIQTIKSDITKAALVQRMEDAQGAPLYVRLNELEQWDKVEGATGRNNQFTVMKQNDDEENDFGSDRASTQSVMGSGSLHLNWNANTTVSKALKYFRYVVTDGPISRLCLATIPDCEIGSDIPVFGNYDEAYDESLKPYIDNLKTATGVIVCQQAMRLASKLKAECADFARLSQDTVFDNLTHRALVHAFRKACLLYAANGMKWEKSIEDFCRWSLFYDLYLKMKFWGDSIRSADSDVQISKRGPESLLDSLPTQFTLEDAKRVRQQKGMDAERARKMISTWQSRYYVIQMSDFSFKKLSESEREEMKKAKNKS